MENEHFALIRAFIQDQPDRKVDAAFREEIMAFGATLGIGPAEVAPLVDLAEQERDSG